MDFRNCPSCKASVLEDDAQECPFCGASMSGKPGAAPKPAPQTAKPAQKKSSPSVPASAGAPAGAGTKPAARAEKPAPKPPESNDPFDVDNSALRSTSPVSPKPAKGRSIEVVCPMCETKGYITEKQAGRDVKCCNPDCMVPVFRAPALAKKEEVVVDKGMSAATLSILGVVGAAVIGGAVYFFVLKGPEVKTPEVVDRKIEQPTPEQKKNETNNLIPDGNVQEVTDKPPANVGDLETKSLKEIVKDSQQRGETRSQPVTKQYAAEALALRGKTAEAKEQITLVKQIGGSRGTYEIEPLVRLAWADLKRGDKTAATASADAALKASEKLAKVGREAIDAATSLAALLVGLGRDGEATVLVQEIPSDDRARASAIWLVARETGTFDVTAASQMSFLYANPQTAMAATAFSAALKGDPALAIKWAKSAPNPAVRDAALAACAAAVSSNVPSRAESGVPEALAAEFAGAEPAGKIRMLVAVADAELLKKNQAGAAAALAKAEALASGIAPGKGMAIPEMTDIYYSEGRPFAGLPDPFAALDSALALADVGDLQMRLGKKPEGWTNLEKGLAVLRSATPSADAVQAQLDQAEKQSDEIQTRLRTALNLPNDAPKLRLAATRYRRQLQALLEISHRRKHLAELFLQRAVDRGMLEQVVPLVIERQKARGNDQEKYLASPLGGMLLQAAEQAGKTDLVASLKGADAGLQVPANLTGLVQARAAFDAGNPEGAAEALRGVYANPNIERWRTDIRVLGAVTGNLGTAKAFDFAHRLRDPLIREDALRLIASRSILDNTWPEMWRLTAETTALNHTDRAAIRLGFVEAMKK